MITRTWHGATLPDRAAAYLQFLLTDGTKDYKITPGNISVEVHQKKSDEICHFWTVTEWQDLESIKLFAGEDPEKAKYYPIDDEFLLEKEVLVSHTETYDLSGKRIGNYIHQLENLYDGDNWVGETFIGKLEDLDETNVFEEPFPGGNTIAGIIRHCYYWRIVLIKRLQGDHDYRNATVVSQNFLSLAQLKQKGWEEIKTELAQSQKLLIDLLGNIKDEELNVEFNDGYDLEYFLTGIIHHDVYHIGQLGLLRRLLAEKSK